MTLQTTGRGTGGQGLDVMSKMVYQCAERGKTIRKVMETLGLEQQMAHRIIQQLVGQGLINVIPTKVREPSSAPTEKPPEKLVSQSGLRLTPEYLEALEKRYEQCEKANYYDMLEIDPDTPRKELRTHYFELSKQYHPDKVFGEIPKDIRRKMLQVFQCLTTAYDTLSNPKRRAEYNETITDELEVFNMEKKLKQAMRESVPPPPAGESSHSGDRYSVPPSGSGSDRSQKKTSFVPSNSPRKTYTVRRNQIRRNLANRALQNLLSRRPVPQQNANDINNLFERAEEAMDQSQHAAAAKILGEILQMVPDNPQALEMLAAVNAENNRIQLQQHIRRGRFAKNENRFDEAKWHYEQALLLDKDNIDARHLLAEMLLETSSDLHKALDLMKEVVVLGGQRARYYVTLGDIFLSLKEPGRAQDAFKKAFRLEPDNKEIQKRIK